MVGNGLCVHSRSTESREQLSNHIIIAQILPPGPYEMKKSMHSIRNTYNVNLYSRNLKNYRNSLQVASTNYPGMRSLTPEELYLYCQLQGFQHTHDHWCLTSGSTLHFGKLHSLKKDAAERTAMRHQVVKYDYPTMRNFQHCFLESFSPTRPAGEDIKTTAQEQPIPLAGEDWPQLRQ